MVNVWWMKSCTKPWSQLKTQQKHTSASQGTTSRQGMGTTKCPLDTKREKVRLN